MIDALLYAVRDAVRAYLKYDYTRCEIRDDGRPPPRCGDIFIAVHQLGSSSEMDNALDEYSNFGLTLTMRVTNVPIDRVGDQMLAKKKARETGFNAILDRLDFLHMNWQVLANANQYLVEMVGDVQEVYGFAEPARYRGAEVPVLVGGEHFWAEPDSTEIGLKAMARFERCRRLQAIGSFS